MARWAELELETRDSMVSMAYEYHKSEGFSINDWSKLVKGLDVGDDPDNLGDPRMRFAQTHTSRPPLGPPSSAACSDGS